MKFSIISLAVTLLLEIPNHAMADWQQKESSDFSAFNDEQIYWGRLLRTEHGSSMSVPTSATPPPTPKLPPTSEQSIPKAPTGGSDVCFSQVSVECIPPEGFTDCNISPGLPEQCLGDADFLTFRFTGGDCRDSNNIHGPASFTCEDFFGGPPAAVDIGAEAYMIITDAEEQDIVYFDGIIRVGENFNIASILPNPAIAENINVTIYEGSPAPENIRETMLINTNCNVQTFLFDRFGVLGLVGFASPDQGGPEQCLGDADFLAFQFNGGDCRDSNNIHGPAFFTCEDFFGGPPAAVDIGAEA